MLRFCCVDCDFPRLLDGAIVAALAGICAGGRGAILVSTATIEGCRDLLIDQLDVKHHFADVERQSLGLD